MHIAAQKNHLSICWLLLTQNIPNFKNINQIEDDDDDVINNVSHILHQVDKWGNIPLHTAASNGHEKLVKWFLDVGSNSRIKNMYNFTPFDVASNKQCRMLLRRQMDDSMDNGKQETIRHVEKVDSHHSSSIPHNTERVKQVLQKYRGFQTKLTAMLCSNKNDGKCNDIGDSDKDMSDNVTTSSTIPTTAVNPNDNALDLNQIQDLIDDAAEFGLTRDIIDKSLQHLKWLKTKQDIWIHIQDVKDNSPIITPTKYCFVNDLKRIIHNVQYHHNNIISVVDSSNSGSNIDRSGQNENEEKVRETTDALPEEIKKVIKVGLALCDQSTAEFNLYKACQECQKVLFTTSTDYDGNGDGKDTNTNTNNNTNTNTNISTITIMMEILQKTIHLAKDVNADKTLIKEGELLHSRILSEQALLEARNSIPKNIKLPPPAETPMTTKQTKMYWVDVVDIGYIQQTEGYPLPPPPPDEDDGDVSANTTSTSYNGSTNADKVGDYIWIKSESLQSLEGALLKIEHCINNATSFGANCELIESCQKLVKDKRDGDLKALLEKDQMDRLAALAVTEKAAKKLLKKKKKKGSKK